MFTINLFFTLVLFELTFFLHASRKIHASFTITPRKTRAKKSRDIWNSSHENDSKISLTVLYQPNKLDIR